MRTVQKPVERDLLLAVSQVCNLAAIKGSEASAQALREAQSEVRQREMILDFQPHLIRERNEQVQREVDSLRLQERLREDRGSSGSRFVALARMRVMPLLRAARLAG